MAKKKIKRKAAKPAKPPVREVPEMEALKQAGVVPPQAVGQPKVAGLEDMMSLLAAANKGDDRAVAFKEMVTRLFSHKKEDLFMSSRLGNDLLLWLAKQETAQLWFYQKWIQIAARGKWVLDKASGRYKVVWSVNYGRSKQMRPEAWNTYLRSLMALTVSSDNGAGRREILQAMSNAEQRMLQDLMEQQRGNALQRFVS
jgi:hypothetical protein